jgi:hypothetical protein
MHRRWLWSRCPDVAPALGLGPLAEATAAEEMTLRARLLAQLQQQTPG